MDLQFNSFYRGSEDSEQFELYGLGRCAIVDSKIFLSGYDFEYEVK